jgi:hypothetical protein
MLRIRSFRDLPEAEIARAALASAGVASFLANEWFVRGLGDTLRVRRKELP